MGLPDYSYCVAGTPLVWTSSGGDKVLNLSPAGAGIAAGVARQGDKSATLLDATLGMPEFLEIRLEAKPVSAPADGGTIDLHIGESDSATAGTQNPGGLTGADGTLANPTQIPRQLHYAGALSLSNGLGAAIQVARIRYFPSCICIIPVVVNNCSVALSNTGTDHRVVVTPYYRKIAE